MATSDPTWFGRQFRPCECWGPWGSEPPCSRGSPKFGRPSRSRGYPNFRIIAGEAVWPPRSSVPSSRRVRSSGRHDVGLSAVLPMRRSGWTWDVGPKSATEISRYRSPNTHWSVIGALSLTLGGALHQVVASNGRTTGFYDDEEEDDCRRSGGGCSRIVLGVSVGRHDHRMGTSVHPYGNRHLRSYLTQLEFVNPRSPIAARRSPDSFSRPPTALRQLGHTLGAGTGRTPSRCSNPS